MTSRPFNPKKHCVRKSAWAGTPTPHLFQMIVRVEGKPTEIRCCWCGRKKPK